MSFESFTIYNFPLLILLNISVFCKSFFSFECVFSTWIQFRYVDFCFRSFIFFFHPHRKPDAQQLQIYIGVRFVHNKWWTVNLLSNFKIICEHRLLRILSLVTSDKVTSLCNQLLLPMNIYWIDCKIYTKIRCIKRVVSNIYISCINQ